MAVFQPGTQNIENSKAPNLHSIIPIASASFRSRPLVNLATHLTTLRLSGEFLLNLSYFLWRKNLATNKRETYQNKLRKKKKKKKNAYQRKVKPLFGAPKISIFFSGCLHHGFQEELLIRHAQPDPSDVHRKNGIQADVSVRQEGYGQNEQNGCTIEIHGDTKQAGVFH